MEQTGQQRAAQINDLAKRLSVHQERDLLGRALWDIYVAAGADTDGDTGPGAYIAGMGLEGFARVVLDEVRELAARYRESLADPPEYQHPEE